MVTKAQMAVEIMLVAKQSGLEWPEQQEALKLAYRELARENCPLDKSTREFIGEIDGLGHGAMGIVQRFPTVAQLCAANYYELHAINCVGDITLYRIYGKLIEEGYEPKWNPYNYR